MIKLHSLTVGIGLLVLTIPTFSQDIQPAQQREDKFPELHGPYLGQKPPELKPEVFAPGIISTLAYEHGALAFSPDGQELYWSVFQEKEFLQSIFFMQLKDGKWTPPQKAPFCDEQYLDGNPVFSHDGQTLYFTSNRPGAFPGAPDKFDLWIWKVKKTAQGWSEPTKFTEVAKPFRLVSAPTFSADGSLYAVPWNKDSLSIWDIYRLRLGESGYAPPENLGQSINTKHMEEYPFIAPDESYMLFGSNRPGGLGKEDLYVSFRKKDGTWSEPLNLGAAINFSASERFPCISPDGKYFFFGSDKNGNTDYYWVDAKIIEDLKPKELDLPGPRLNIEHGLLGKYLIER